MGHLSDLAPLAFKAAGTRTNVLKTTAEYMAHGTVLLVAF